MIDEICGVCKKSLSPYVRIATCVNCASNFHVGHLKEWLKIKNTCPICRKLLEDKSIIYKIQNKVDLGYEHNIENKIYCTKCGTKNTTESSYCYKCGNVLLGNIDDLSVKQQESEQMDKIEEHFTISQFNDTKLFKKEIDFLIEVENILKSKFILKNDKFLTMGHEIIGSSEEKFFKQNKNYLTFYVENFHVISLGLVNCKSSEILNCDFSILRKLRVLYLSRNDFKFIPESISKCNDLDTIDLGKNQLVTLPESFKNLIKLTYLDLGFNKFESFPDCISSFENLEELIVHHNQIIKIPYWISSLVKLTHIYLNRNKITELPDSIGKLYNLKALYLDNNFINDFPENIGKLTKLEYLDLSNNQIISIPESIGNLERLNSLNLFYNKITRLPTSIGKLKTLEELNLAENQLSSLPKSLKALSKLHFLNLVNNLELGERAKVYGESSLENITSLIGYFAFNVPQERWFKKNEVQQFLETL